MMKIKIIIPMIAAMGLLGACSSADDEVRVGENMPIKLAISVEESAQTRAGSTTQNTKLRAGEAVDVYIQNASSSAWIANPLSCSVTGNSGDLTPSSTLYYPYDGSSVSMYAVHPHVTSGAAFTVNADQTSDANYAASDLTYSKMATYAYSSSAQTLPMVHTMAKIIVNVNVPAGLGTGSLTNLKLHAKRTATFTFPVENSVGYTLSAASGDGEISCSAGGAVVIPPQTISSGATFITFNIPGVGPYIYKLTADKTFEAGKQYTYTLTPTSGTLSYASTSVTRKYTKGAFTNPLTNTGNGQVVYTSSNTAVATVNSTTGEVTPVKVGSVTITATIPGGQDNGYSTKTASYSLTINGMSPSDVGKVLGSNGTLYSTKSAATSAGTTPSGIVAYVGFEGSAETNTTYSSLIIAFTDGNTSAGHQWYTSTSGTCVTQTTTYVEGLQYKNGLACTNTLVNSNGTGVTKNCNGHTHQIARDARNTGTARPSGASAWFLPSIGQWQLIVSGLATKKAGTPITTALYSATANDYYKPSYLNSVITNAGGTGLTSTDYWSSTEASVTTVTSMFTTQGRLSALAKTRTEFPFRAVFAY